MNHKISIILPTNRINDKVFTKVKNIQTTLEAHKYKNIFNNEFIPLIKDNIKDISHYLELTLNSLEKQTYKDFELIITHKHPEDVPIKILDKYHFPIKLVKEKHSLWHDLGDNYPTLCNNINTGVIQSSGRLLWRLDDLTFFNDKLIEELWNNWGNGYYTTSRTFRCIDANKRRYKTKSNRTQIGQNKYLVEKNGWTGQYKPLTIGKDSIIPKWMCWGCSSTVSTIDYLDVNGHDEIWDGSINGTDMELGARLAKRSGFNRMASKNLVYEINDVPYKYSTRRDVMFREMIGYRGYRANCWKPIQKHMDEYKQWHIDNIGELDKNWDIMLKIPYIDMELEYKNKLLGEVIYESD